MILHADAVAENCAAGKRAGGIDGKHADGLALGAKAARQSVDQRALPCAGRAGYAYAQRSAGIRETLRQDFAGNRRCIFNQRDGPGESTHIASPYPFDETRYLRDGTVLFCIRHLQR